MREWWETKRAAWGFIVLGIGGGSLLTYISPSIGIPVCVVLVFIGLCLLWHAYRFNKVTDKDSSSIQIDTSNVAKIIQELDTTTITLNKVEVSIARLFWGLSDFFTGAWPNGGLRVDVLSQLLAQRFQEHNPAIWSSAQVKLITTLRRKNLLDIMQQAGRKGTTTYWVATDSGLDVLDKLKTKGWPEPKVV